MYIFNLIAILSIFQKVLDETEYSSKCAIKYENSDFCEINEPPFDKQLGFKRVLIHSPEVRVPAKHFNATEKLQISLIKGPSKIKLQSKNIHKYYLLKENNTALCYVSETRIFCDVFNNS